MRLPQQPIRWTALPKGGVRPAPAAVMPHLSPVRPRNVGCPLLPGAEATPSSSLACRGSQDFEVLRGARWVAGSAGFPVTSEVTGVTCEWFERKEPCSHLSQMPFVTNVCVVDVSHLFSRVCHMPDRMTGSTMTVHREGFSCREQTRRLRHLESRPLCLSRWAAVPRKRAPSWRPRRLLMSHSRGLGHIPHPRRQSLEDGVGFPARLSSRARVHLRGPGM